MLALVFVLGIGGFVAYRMSHSGERDASTASEGAKSADTAAAPADAAKDATAPAPQPPAAAATPEPSKDQAAATATTDALKSGREPNQFAARAVGQGDDRQSLARRASTAAREHGCGRDARPGAPHDGGANACARRGAAARSLAADARRDDALQAGGFFPPHRMRAKRRAAVLRGLLGQGAAVSGRTEGVGPVACIRLDAVVMRIENENAVQKGEQ